MNGQTGELSLSAIRAKRGQHVTPRLHEPPAFRAREPYSPPPATPPEPRTETEAKPSPQLKFDPWRLVTALKNHSRRIGLAGIVVAVVAFGAGYLVSSYHVKVTLLARETGAASVPGAEKVFYQSPTITPQTMVNLISSPELLRRVAAQSQPPLAEDSVAGRVRVEPVRDTDMITLTVAGKGRQSLVDFANRFAAEAVAAGRELQIADAKQTGKFCGEKLVALDQQMHAANTELVQFQNTEKLADPDAERAGYVKQLSEVMARADTARIEAELADVQATTLAGELAQQNPIAQKLEAARGKLTDLYGQYTEAHPAVQSQRKLITELERQLLSAGNSTLATSKYSDNPQVSAMYARLVDWQGRKIAAQRELTELTKLRETLQAKVTGLSEKGLQYTLLKSQLDGLQKSRVLLATRQREAQLAADHPAGDYRVFAPATLKDVNASSRWLAGLLAAGVGLLLGVIGAGLVVVGSEVADGRLKTVADVERITGLPVLATLGDLNAMTDPEKAAWAFRTWTAISGQLNSSPNHGMVCGFISSAPGEGRSTWINLLVQAARQRGLHAVTVTTTRPAAETPEADNKSDLSGVFARVASGSLMPQILAAPAAHIPLPGKVWNLEQRKEWQSTLADWRAMDNLVLLTELPPASVPEAVLLAESLPQLIWLVDGGVARVRATREQLQTLRHAKCKLVGAVLNHEPKPVFEL